MSPDRTRLPTGLTLIAQPKVDGCAGCWFDQLLDGCIGFLEYQPGCGSLTRDDGREIIWVEPPAGAPTVTDDKRNASPG